jgi:hypothetical protein
LVMLFVVAVMVTWEAARTACRGRGILVRTKTVMEETAGMMFALVLGKKVRVVEAKVPTVAQRSYHR